MHVPVLVNEVVTFLNAAKVGIFLDGTVGLGGHCAAILNASPHNYLYGTDKDCESLDIAKKKLEEFSGQFTFFHSDFKHLETLPIKIDKIDGFLFDLGVSSFQLENPDRGFSYSREAPLDMRMDKSGKISAYDVINDYNYDELYDVFRKYGEIENPTRITEQIVFHRKQKKIESTDDLKRIIRRIAPKRKTMDPLARVFQAVRIEVNQELTGLEAFFSKLVHSVKPGSRIVIISFHSLEDKIVKSVFKTAKQDHLIKLLTKKPLAAKKDELQMNIRARSAKLRACEKIYFSHRGHREKEKKRGC
jgi:16S rRNA (cytosine1402-N4)-methyltransferase